MHARSVWIHLTRRGFSRMLFVELKLYARSVRTYLTRRVCWWKFVRVERCGLEVEGGMTDWVILKSPGSGLDWKELGSIGREHLKRNAGNLGSLDPRVQAPRSCPNQALLVQVDNINLLPRASCDPEARRGTFPANTQRRISYESPRSPGLYTFWPATFEAIPGLDMSAYQTTRLFSPPS